MKKLIFIYCLFSIFLSGCSNKIPGLTEEEKSMMVTYASDLLMQYSPNHDTRLIPIEKQQENEVDIPLDENSEIENLKETQETTSFLIENIQITYQGYEILETYGDKNNPGISEITASKGKDLYVFHFSLKNLKEVSYLLDMSLENIDYQMYKDSQKIYPLIGIFSNNLFCFKDTFAPKEEKEAVLIVQMKKDEFLSEEIILKIMDDTKEKNIILL